MAYLVLFEKVEVYYWFYMHAIALKNNYRRAYMKSYSYLTVLLMVFHPRVYHLLGAYFILFLFDGYPKSKDQILLLKLVKRLCSEKEIVIRCVMVCALSVCDNWFRFTSSCS